jgi:GNAT superfamily N-acetyltransferase
MSDIQIRKAEAGDLVDMQEIARRTIDKSYRAFLGDEAVDWFINSGESDKELEGQMEDCDVLLKENKIVAIYFRDLIHLMMVDVRLHRRGIGSRLLAHCEKRLFAWGNTIIRLETFEGNHQAINFYIKNGWSVVGRQEDKEHGFVRVCFEKKA